MLNSLVVGLYLMLHFWLFPDYYLKIKIKIQGLQNGVLLFPVVWKRRQIVQEPNSEHCI